MSESPELTPRAPIGSVREATVGGFTLPMVKITDAEWIIRDALKYIPGANTKNGSDLFIRENAE